MMDRRDFLKVGLATIAGAGLPAATLAAVPERPAMIRFNRNGITLVRCHQVELQQQLEMHCWPGNALHENGWLWKCYAVRSEKQQDGLMYCVRSFWELLPTSSG